MSLTCGSGFVTIWDHFQIGDFMEPQGVAAPADGLHFGVPFFEYLQWPVCSQSSLKQGQKSMAHYRAARDGERTMVPTDAMVLGTAMHTAFLEPDEAAQRIAVWRGGARRGKDWEEFKFAYSTRILLTENQETQLNGMVASLRRHPEVRAWQDKIEDVEVACVGDVCGFKMKGRCDALTAAPLIDLKKVADGSAYKVIRAVEDFGYHLQAWIYCQLFKRERFMLICVEDEPPYDVIPYEFSPAYFRSGERQAKQLIERVMECEAKGEWPGRSSKPVLLEPPQWSLPEVEIDGI